MPNLTRLDVIPTRITSVARVQDLGPWFRRITFAGGDLVHHQPIAPDEFVYVLLPPPGRTELTIDSTFTWTKAWEMPPDEQPVGAYYTVRAFRPDGGAGPELDIDVFLHEVAGHASGWARRARPGDPVALWGPRTAFTPPDAPDWWLLAADESGLPALAAILEWLPVGAEVRAFVEVPSAAEVAPALPSHPRLAVLERGAVEAGTTTLLADAVRAAARPDGRPYVWGGGESRGMTAIRRYVRHELGYERDRVSLTAYWRHAAHADDPVDDEEQPSA